MRRLILTGLVLCGTEQVAWAQSNNCQAPQPNCQAPQYCYPQRCCPPKKEREVGEPETAPEGAFVGGPESAETAGESNSVGLRFGTLRIPELTIPFPTIQLPCLVRFRHDAERITGPTHLPFVEGGVQEYSLRPEREEEEKEVPEAGPGEDVPPEQPCYQPHYCPPCVPGACTSNDANQRIQQLQQQIAQLSAAVTQLASISAQAPVLGHVGMSGQAASRTPMTSAAVAGSETRPQTANGAAAPTTEELSRLRAEFTQRLEAQQEEFQSNYEQKCEEIKSLQEQLGETQAQYLRVLESRAADVRQQRNDRLLQELQQTSSTQAESDDVAPGLPEGEQPRPLPANMQPRDELMPLQSGAPNSPASTTSGMTIDREVIQTASTATRRPSPTTRTQAGQPARSTSSLLQRVLGRGR